MTKTAPTRKTSKTGKKTTQAKAAQKTAPKKAVGTKKGSTKAAQPAFLPLKGTTYVFVDFKDEAMAAEIVSFGGKVTRSVKTADVLVCEDIWEDKAMEAMNKYDKHDYARSKDSVLEHLEELSEMRNRPIPTLQVGKKHINVLSEWFTGQGVPLSLPNDDEAPNSMVMEDELTPYDCCFHSDGNVADMFTQLSRLQLLHDSTSSTYIIIQKTAFLDDLVNGNISSTSTCGRRENLDDAVKSFQESFREAVGYTWKNRATCKPKKGWGLAVDLNTFTK